LTVKVAASTNSETCSLGRDNTMTEITDRQIIDFIKRFYRPFRSHEEFKKGFSALHTGDFLNPYCSGSLSALAWDCGIEAAIHYRLTRLIISSAMVAAIRPPVSSV